MRSLRIFCSKIVKPLLVGCMLTAWFATVASVTAAPNEVGSAGNSLDVGSVTPDMTAEWWQWAVSIWQFATPGDPAATKIHPLRTEKDTPPGEVDPSSADCMVGQHGSLWFLGGSFLQVDLIPNITPTASVQSPSSDSVSPVPDITRTCEIPLGTAILMPVLNGECNTAEEIHLGNLTGGETLQERLNYLQTCAKVQADAITTAEASFGEVEGSQRSLNVRRVHTPQPFSLTYPPDHILQFGGEIWQPTVNPSLAFADGYWVLVKPLQPGTYELNTFGDVPAIPFSLRIKYILTIVGPQD
jgi:hypothetical protein